MLFVFEVFIVRYCFAPVGIVALLLLERFAPCVGLGTLSQEGAQGSDDDKRVNGAIEVAVTPSLEPAKEEHDFRDFEVVEILGDDFCQLLERTPLKFLTATAVLRQVVELRCEPCLSRLPTIGSIDLSQRREVREEAFADVGGDSALDVRVEGYQELFTGAVGLDNLLTHS